MSFTVFTAFAVAANVVDVLVSVSLSWTIPLAEVDAEVIVFLVAVITPFVS